MLSQKEIDSLAEEYRELRTERRLLQKKIREQIKDPELLKLVLNFAHTEALYAEIGETLRWADES